MDNYDRLTVLLDRYSGKLESLVTALEEEHTSLNERNITSLQQSTAKKQDLLKDISGLEMERNQLNKDFQLTPDNLPADIEKLNSRIRELIEKCKVMNETNGAVIELSSQFNYRILEIMLGSGEENQLYDSNGKNSAKLANNSVARI